MAPDSHPYIPNSCKKIAIEMLKEIGIKSIEELFRDIPRDIPKYEARDLPRGHSEFETRRVVRSIASKNKTVHEMPTFLGAGVWPHYVPAAVDMIVSRSEFLTSYTPYQAEISQGMLQALFEYQSMMAELLEMDVVNSSLYDWSTALGEAALMVKRVTQRNVILFPRIIHPERLRVLRTYGESAGIKIDEVPYDKRTGKLSLQELRNRISHDVAAVYIENPSYLGFIEDQVEDISLVAHEKGSLLVVGVDPTSLGVLRPPGDYGADIAIGEGQPLGNHMNFGGPLLGIFSCRDDQKVIRQMPGRIVGMTTTLDGNETGFVLTLQTREQHIRREKATSNITSNEALCALAASAYCSLLGAKGLKELGETILTHSNYAIKKLGEIKGLKVPVLESSHFKEFTLNTDQSRKSISDLNKKLLASGIQGGHPINNEFPEFGNTALFCVTEIHSKDDIDKLILSCEEILAKGR
nr:aminomethyl-transferring glycine dehydrogenase subunit GcvPA [Candidatus Njordarchaeum guaymaensis]